MKVYTPNNSRDQVGGGWTFLRTFRKYGARIGMEFVDNMQNADVILVSGITLIEPSEIAVAKSMGKKIIFRVDNVPRKSRNRRNTPHERMKEVAEICDAVVYQSEWAMDYCKPLCGDGTVIYNGVDREIFKPAQFKNEWERWLFAYHGKNDIKQFWLAHLLFQKRFRENPNAEFWFINDFGRDLEELKDSKFDFWNGEKWVYMEPVGDAQTMADIMQKCTHLVHPAISDAAPQTVIEARACGLEIVHPASKDLAGTQELMDPNLDISAERMVEEYMALFKLVIHTPDY